MSLAAVAITFILAGSVVIGAGVAAALAFTAASFLTLGSLEALTLRHIGGRSAHAAGAPNA